ncbi:MAG: hypothetical protein ACO1RX_11370 [Candidatus Sericytochromatia bacterium]
MGQMMVGSTNYTAFSRIGRENIVAPLLNTSQLDADAQTALADAQNTTRRVLSTGIVGDGAKDATAVIGQLEKVSSLSQGDINAVNIKAAMDLGQKFTQGQVQQLLGTVATPIGAVISVEQLQTNIDKAFQDPSAQNVKTLVTVTRDAGMTFSKLTELAINYGDDALALAGRYGGGVGELLTKGMGTKAAGAVKTGLSQGGQLLGRVSKGLNIGIAAMDIWIAGNDIKNFWNDPSGKNLAKMSLGVVAAGASVLSTVPGIGTKAAMVATLADVGKMGVDVNWAGVYEGTKTQVSTFAQVQANNLKRDLVASRLPQGAMVAAPTATQSMTIGQSFMALNGRA